MLNPTSGIPVPKLAIIAKALGQNVGAVDDHCRFLSITESDIDRDPSGVADRVADLINELENACGGWQ